MKEFEGEWEVWGVPVLTEANEEVVWIVWCEEATDALCGLTGDIARSWSPGKVRISTGAVAVGSDDGVVSTDT